MARDELDAITDPNGLTYPCGCAVKVVHTWVVETITCGELEHAWLGHQTDL